MFIWVRAHVYVCVVGVYVRVGMCTTCVWAWQVCARLCTHVWKSSLLLSTLLYFKTHSLTEPEAHRFS